MEKFLRVLRFLRVTDESDNISLTNLAIIAALVNLMICKDAQLADVSAFLGTVVGYQVKRFAKPTSAPNTETEDLKKAIADLETKFAALHLGNSFRQ